MWDASTSIRCALTDRAIALVELRCRLSPHLDQRSSGISRWVRHISQFALSEAESETSDACLTGRHTPGSCDSVDCPLSSLTCGHEIKTTSVVSPFQEPDQHCSVLMAQYHIPFCIIPSHYLRSSISPGPQSTSVALLQRNILFGLRYSARYVI